MDAAIGKGFIEVVVKGLDKVQQQFAALRNSVGSRISAIGKATSDGISSAMTKVNEVANNLGNTFEKIGSIATKAFAAGSASITGFVRLASPRGFDDLTVALATVGIQLGTIFVPLLRQATAIVNEFATYLKGLTDAQKDNILRWVEIGGAIAAALMIIPKVIQGIRLLSSVMQAFGVSSAIATGGITLLLAAAAAALPYLMQLFQNNGGGVGGAFAAAGEALQRLWGMAQSVFERISPLIQAFVARLGPLFERIMPIVERVFTAIMGWFDTLVTTLTNVLDPLFNIITRVVEVIGAVLVPVFDIIGKVLEALAPVFEMLMDVLSTVVDLVATVLVPVIELFATVIEAAVSLLTPIFEIFAAVVKDIVDLLADILRPALQWLADAIREVVAAMRRAINGLIDVMNGFIRWYNEQSWLPGNGRIREISHLGERRQRGGDDRTSTGGGGDFGNPNRPTQDHRGDMRVQQAQLVGIADMWKRVQTAQVDDPNTRILQEQLAASNRIAANTDPANRPQQGNDGWGAHNPGIAR